jgi:hypothetical protein
MHLCVSVVPPVMEAHDVAMVKRLQRTDFTEETFPGL